MHSKRKKHSWWDEEAKEAVKKRKEACREHRKYSRLNKSFPEVIAKEKVEEDWGTYLQAKQNAKDLVAEKKKTRKGWSVWKSLRKWEGMVVVNFGEKWKKVQLRGWSS